MEGAQRLIASLRNRGLMFMDGLMFMHHPRYRSLQRAILSEDPEEGLGELVSVQTGFSFPGMQDPAFVQGNIRLVRFFSCCVRDIRLSLVEIALSCRFFGGFLPKSESPSNCGQLQSDDGRRPTLDVVCTLVCLGRRAS